jgi:SAM-dependent methyltransferase
MPPGEPDEGVPELPAADTSRQLAEWLSGPRSRALRKAQIGIRKSVLEVGAGHCVVTPELVRRAAGRVVNTDIIATFEQTARIQQLTGLAADGRALPFRDATFDLVFFQNTLLWIDDPAAAITESARVMDTDAALVAIEPDYGGMIEYPDMGLREVWTDSLQRAGADPHIGRKLPNLCESAGLEVSIELAHLPRKAGREALDLLADLPLTEAEQYRSDAAAQIIADAPGWSCFVHVPYFLVLGTKR